MRRAHTIGVKSSTSDVHRLANLRKLFTVTPASELFIGDLDDERRRDEERQALTARPSRVLASNQAQLSEQDLKASLPPPYGEKCHLCSVRNVTYISGRSLTPSAAWLPEHSLVVH